MRIVFTPVPSSGDIVSVAKTIFLRPKHARLHVRELHRSPRTCLLRLTSLLVAPWLRSVLAEDGQTCAPPLSPLNTLAPSTGEGYARGPVATQDDINAELQVTPPRHATCFPSPPPQQVSADAARARGSLTLTDSCPFTSIHRSPGGPPGSIPPSHADASTTSMGRRTRVVGRTLRARLHNAHATPN